MDIQRAKELLTVLADGIDPLTGEVLPQTDSCNQADIVRALHAVLLELDKQPKKKAKPLPENAGKPWAAADDEQLRIAYRSGETLSDLAKEYKRTTGSIAARLVRIGEIKKRQDARRSRELYGGEEQETAFTEKDT